MLTDYIRVAMGVAHYELLGGDSYYGEVPGLQGVYAEAASLEECRDELQSALEDWLLFSLRSGAVLPPMGGIDLNIAKSA